MSEDNYVPIDVVSKRFTVSNSTIRAWVKSGHIPLATYVRVGNTYRFNLGEVISTLHAQSLVDEPSEPDAEEDYDLDEFDEDL
jgi:excisionase family DNA binding protein